MTIPSKHFIQLLWGEKTHFNKRSIIIYIFKKITTIAFFILHLFSWSSVAYLMSFTRFTTSIYSSCELFDLQTMVIKSKSLLSNIILQNKERFWEATGQLSAEYTSHNDDQTPDAHKVTSRELDGQLAGCTSPDFLVYVTGIAANGPVLVWTMSVCEKRGHPLYIKTSPNRLVSSLFIIFQQFIKRTPVGRQEVWGTMYRYNNPSPYHLIICHR